MSDKTTIETPAPWAKPNPSTKGSSENTYDGCPGYPPRTKSENALPEVTYDHIPGGNEPKA